MPWIECLSTALKLVSCFHATFFEKLYWLSTSQQQFWTIAPELYSYVLSFEFQCNLIPENVWRHIVWQLNVNFTFLSLKLVVFVCQMITCLSIVSSCTADSALNTQKVEHSKIIFNEQFHKLTLEYIEIIIFGRIFTRFLFVWLYFAYLWTIFSRQFKVNSIIFPMDSNSKTNILISLILTPKNDCKYWGFCWMIIRLWLLEYRTK